MSASSRQLKYFRVVCVCAPSRTESSHMQPWRSRAPLWTETNLLFLRPPLSHFQSKPPLRCGAPCLMSHRRQGNCQQVKLKRARSAHGPRLSASEGLHAHTHTVSAHTQPGEMVLWILQSQKISSSLVYLWTPAFTPKTKPAVRRLDCPHKASLELWRCRNVANGGRATLDLWMLWYINQNCSVGRKAKC